MTLTAQVAAAVQLSLREDLGVGDKDFSLLKFSEIEFLNGLSNGQADLAYYARRTLAASTTEDLDLAGGSLSDPNGNLLTFVTVKLLLIRSFEGNGGTLVVGGDGNSADIGLSGSSTVIVNPGGRFLIVAPNTGYTITADTGDILQVQNTSLSQSIYDIVILGTSA